MFPMTWATFMPSFVAQTRFHTSSPTLLLLELTEEGITSVQVLRGACTTPDGGGEREIKFYMDGDREFPTICGTGTEDYFGGAYNWDVDGQDVQYSTPFVGMYQVLHPDGMCRSQQRFSMYRWHIMVASVAYWYQNLPTSPFPELPDTDYLEII